MASLRVFKCRERNCTVLMPNAKPIIFFDGRVETDAEDEIKFLEDEIKAGHPHIFIDAQEVEVDKDKKDPLYALKEKMRQEILAEMATAIDKTNDAGSTTNASTLGGIGNSSSTEGGAPDSNSQSTGISTTVAEKLANLRAGGTLS
jgi:hypothetical protein